MNSIFKRRSVRSYTGEPVTQEQMELLLRAAMRAPSAGNEQPWEFIVLRDRASMEKIQSFHPYARMLSNADCAVVVLGNKAYAKFPAEYWVQDCAAATQNMLLQAVEMGLGAVWLGVYPEKERIEGLTEMFSLPEGVIPFCIVALGHPDGAAEPMDTYKPERVHMEKW